MVIKGKRTRLGEVRIRLLRVVQLLSLGTFLASLFTMVKVYDLPPYIVLLALLPLAFLYAIDRRVMKQEIEYVNEENDAVQQILKKLDILIGKES